MKIEKIYGLLLIILSSGQLSGQSFTNVGVASFEGLNEAKSEWADFNNDDRLDLITSGINGAGLSRVVVYENNGDNTFNALVISSWSETTFYLNDYDKDGDLDILLAGNDSNIKKTSVFENVGGIAFVEQTFGLTGLSRSALIWEDLDGDGDPDIVMTGLDADSNERAIVYENEGGSYQEIPSIIAPASAGSMAFMDANNDGLAEIMVTAVNQTVIYTTDENLTFTVYNDQLDGLSLNSLTLGDFNEDGFVDFATTGNFQSDLYTNNTVNGFSQVSSFMTGLASSSIDFGDLNNDGLLDLFLTGTDDLGAVHALYYTGAASGGNYSFSATPHSLTATFSGDLALGDFENDGDLDIFQIGNSEPAPSFVADLYVSDQSTTVANNEPSIPGDLQSDTNRDTVFLSWGPTLDDITQTSSLTYNLYISENPSGADLIVSPNANIATGYNKLTHSGNAGFRTEKKIQGLSEGSYYWSVQSLDHAHKGSDFAPEQTFDVCYDINIGNNTTICVGESVDLSVASVPFIQSVQWRTTNLGLVSNDFTYPHQVVEKDTVIAEVTKTFGCVVYDSVIVDAFDLPEFDLGNDTSVCFQQFLPLSVASSGITGVDAVEWRSTNRGFLATDVVAISYEVLVSDTIIAEVLNVNGCVNVDSIIVDVYELPTFNLGNDTTVCFQEFLPLSISSLDVPELDIVNWYSSQTGVLGIDTESIDYQMINKDTIIAEVFNLNGCVYYDTLIVDVLDLPNFSLGIDTSLCIGEYLSLSVSDLDIVGLDSVNWFSNQTGLLVRDNESYNHQVVTKDTIIAEVFNTNRCVSYDTIIVDVNALPVFSIDEDTAICFGHSILLQIDPSFDTINWYSEGSGDLLEHDSWFFNYQVNETDRIVAEVYNDKGCLNYDTIAVDMEPLPVFSLADQEICSEDTVTLNVPGSWEEVNWFTFGNQLLQNGTPTYRFSVEGSTTLWAEVFNSAGCVNYDTVTITELELPIFDLGSDQYRCYGDSVEFDLGNIGVNYSWFDHDDVLVSTAYPFSYLAEETDTLMLLVESAEGCFYEDSLIMNINPLPAFDIMGTDEICAMDTTTLSIFHSDIVGINWYTTLEDSLFTEGLSFNYAPQASGWLYAGLTDQNACATTDSVFITVNPRPEALAGEDALICQDQEVTLGGVYESPADLSFEWSPAATLSAIDVAQPVASPSEPTTYYLEVTNTEGCNEQDTVYIEVNPEIVVDAGGDLAVCLGDSVALGGLPTASGSAFPYTYLWTPAQNLLAVDVANPIAVPVSSGEYVVQVRSGDCLVELDTVQIMVNHAPDITVSEQQSVGPDQSVQLFANGGVSYRWLPEELLDDPQAASPFASPLETTEFSVLITDENGCDSTGYVNVLVQNEIFIPNLFTPNGDGNNDYFKVFGSGVADIRLAVYDLNGNQIFIANSVGQAMELGWDGTTGGSVLPNGTYVWVIDGSFHSGAKLSFSGKNSGTIKLIR